jgi:hypothetical protein
MNTMAPLPPRPVAPHGDAGGVPVAGVSVVTVAYMTGPTLFQHIDSVLAEPLAGELVLIDNGSEPADAQRLRDIAAAEPRVRLFQRHGKRRVRPGLQHGGGARARARAPVPEPRTRCCCPAR